MNMVLSTNLEVYKVLCLLSEPCVRRQIILDTERKK